MTHPTLEGRILRQGWRNLTVENILGIYNYCFLSLCKNCLISPSYSGLPISQKRDVGVPHRRVPILRGG